MRRFLLCIIFLLIFAEKPYAFDISGLQPLAPDGVFSTFSAESLPKNRSSVEIATEKSEAPDFYRFSLKAAYGITDKLEFNMTVPYVYHFTGDSSGIEDIAVGLKYRFHDEGKYGPSMAYMINA